MRLPFLLGAGGPVGTGRQVLSWIALDDVIYAIHHAIRNASVRGPVNVVAPGALPQREFARELGRALRRPAVLPLPAAAVTALFGQMGAEVLLAGQFVEPAALRHSGFTWSVPRLAEALSR
jgi:NAD dependent epimerase/dehydratase family enzyme